MKIEFQGAARVVTGSMHLLHINGKRVLLDCGLYQGKRQESIDRNKTFPFEPASIDAVVLSHAHIDHSGNLPGLVKQGFHGPIYCTPATYDLCQIMFADSAFIQERDAEFVTKQHKKKNLPPAEPLYTVDDVREAMKYFQSVPYNKDFDVLPNVSVKYVDAGHILGSAEVRMNIKNNGSAVRLGFSGDVGRKGMPIIQDPHFMGDVDVLLCESTYGGIVHDPPSDTNQKLKEVIAQAVKQGGKIIVQAFSVGRTQDFIYALNELRQKEQIPRIPIFVDSPLAVNATDIFRKHPECFDEETLALLTNHQDPFGMSGLQYIRSVEESKKLNDRNGPCVIIAASGMCEGGRIRHHLANNIEDAKNIILIIGYQAEHTLGKRLVEKQEEVTIFGEVHKRKADVVVMNSFSAHADGDELLEYVSNFNRKQLRQVFLVHGELDRQQKLQAGLKKNGYENVEIPVRGQQFEI